MNRNVRQVAVVLSLIGSLAASPAYSQQNQTPVPTPRPQAQPGASSRTLTLTPDYSFGQSFYPHFTLPYRPLQAPEPMLTNSPRIEQLIVDNTGVSDTDCLVRVPCAEPVRTAPTMGPGGKRTMPL